MDDINTIRLMYAVEHDYPILIKTEETVRFLKEFDILGYVLDLETFVENYDDAQIFSSEGTTIIIEAVEDF
jgi:hypothetical protein